jgi:hypothetical protein
MIHYWCLQFGNGEEFSVAADGETAPKTRFYRKSDPAPSPAVVDDPRRVTVLPKRHIFFLFIFLPFFFF